MKLTDWLLSWLPNFKAYQYPPPTTGVFVIKVGDLGPTDDRVHFSTYEIPQAIDYVKSRKYDTLILIDLTNSTRVEGTNEQLVNYLVKSMKEEIENA